MKAPTPSCWILLGGAWANGAVAGVHPMGTPGQLAAFCAGACALLALLIYGLSHVGEETES